MRFWILRNDTPEGAPFDFEPDPGDPRPPTALEVLLQAHERVMPDLAFRYGCRAAACGLCTVGVDGRPRLGCRDRVREGARIGPQPGLPVVRDLVTDRSDPAARRRWSPGPTAPAQPGEAWVSLGRCIDCYACLDGCPLSASGQGDPAALLRLQRVRVDPGASPAQRRAALERAEALGLAACADCRACRCGVGIHLQREVIGPLLDG
jgi:succinate dehydrogenase / fumarate reductase iron-sulfur subunit